ncbi:hypothetical protein BC941DRAFT_466523 [Chlamydoabsidia padenii]|nr:hypothetical protein BC941DRAFT_466523 [Chlamydoabsidia padenii]
MKFSIVSLSIAALCLVQQIQAAPTPNTGAIGILSGDKLLADNHLLNIDSHTESKRSNGGALDILSGDKILTDNHLLNIGSHTESKKRSLDDTSLLSRLVGDASLAKVVGSTECVPLVNKVNANDKTVENVKSLLEDILAKDGSLRPVLNDLFHTVDGLMGLLGVLDGVQLTSVITQVTKRDVPAPVQYQLETVITLLHKVLDMAKGDDVVNELVKIVAERVQSALCAQ